MARIYLFFFFRDEYQGVYQLHAIVDGCGCIVLVKPFNGTLYPYRIVLLISQLIITILWNRSNGDFIVYRTNVTFVSFH